MADSKIVKVIGNLDVPIKQKADGTLYTFDPAVSPAEGTTTANGLVGGTTAIDTNRTEPNDHWNGMSLLITSGPQNGQVREITDWVLATGTFTVAPAYGGQILVGITYKVLSSLPADVDVAAIEGKLDDPAHGLVKIKDEIEDIEAKLDDGKTGLASIKTEVSAIEGKLDNPVFGLAQIESEVAALEGKLDDPKVGLISIKTEVSAVEGKLDARLDAAISSRASAAALTTHDGKLDTVDTVVDAIQVVTDKLNRLTPFMDFWGGIIEELQLTGTLQSNLALTGADVVIAGIPANATLIRVIVMFMCRAIENTNAAANQLNGAQNIEVNFAGGGFIDAIALADNLFAVAASTREMGTVIIGTIDVKATVTGNGTCTFRIDAARADQDNLNFNDYQCGIRVYFTI